MEEVIAQRTKGLVVSNIIVLIAAAFLVGMAIWMIGYVGSLGWIVGLFALAMVIVVVVVAVRTLVRIRKVPEVIATREGDTLVFLGERIPLCDIAEATSEQSRTLSWQPTYGLLRIRLKSGRILKNGCVDDVAQACFRLNECLRRYAAEQEQQSFAGNARRPDA